MLFDQENHSSLASAAEEHDPNPKANPEVPSSPEVRQETAASPEASADLPSQETPAAVAAEQVHADEAHAKAESHAANATVDAEAAAAAEEAAGAEEMSKLIDQYSEPQAETTNNEVLEVKVVAYTEHGVVVDLGGKTEGLIPAAEFAETEIPRPEPNATIEVQ